MINITVFTKQSDFIFSKRANVYLRESMLKFNIINNLKDISHEICEDIDMIIVSSEMPNSILMWVIDTYSDRRIQIQPLNLTASSGEKLNYKLIYVKEKFIKSNYMFDSKSSYMVKEFVNIFIPNFTYKDKIESDATIPELLFKMGVYQHMKGFNQLIYAIERFKNSDEKLTTTEVNNDASKKFKTTPMAVERNIRQAILVAYLNGNISDVVNEFYGMEVLTKYQKPTAKVFITILANKYKRG